MFTDVIKRWERSNALLFTTESLSLQTLFKHMGAQNHRVLVMWALETVKAPLHVLEAKYPEELRPRHCLEYSRLWAQGNIKMPLAKKAIQAAHAAAREIDDGAYRALCRAIGHAGATVHVRTHAFGLPIYELTAMVLLLGIDHFQKPVSEKIEYYHERLIYWRNNIELVDLQWADFLRKH